jgi:hypothetical protein
MSPSSFKPGQYVQFKKKTANQNWLDASGLSKCLFVVADRQAYVGGVYLQRCCAACPTQRLWDTLAVGAYNFAFPFDAVHLELVKGLN